MVNVYRSAWENVLQSNYALFDGNILALKQGLIVDSFSEQSSKSD